MAEIITKPSARRVSDRTFNIRMIAVVLSINLFVIGMAGYSLYHSFQQYESHVAIQTQNLSQSISTTLAGIITTTNIALLSVERDVEKQIKSGRVDHQTISHHIRDMKEHIPELDDLRIADAHGDVVYRDSIESGVPANNIADRDHFIYARNNPDAGLIISKPIFGRHAKKWQFNIDRRINNPDGSFAGIAYAAISLKYMSGMFSQFDLGTHGVITLRDSELAIIVRFPESPGGNSNVGSKVVSKELKSLVQAGNTFGTYKVFSRIDSIERTFSFNKIAGYPLYVNVGRATSDYLAPWRSEVRMFVALVALFSLASVVSMWLIYRNRKREAAAEIELICYRDNLEETVQKRTMELESKNVQLAEEITARKLVDAELIKAAFIMDRMPDSVVLVSREGKYVYVNDATCSMHGYTREELLSMTVMDVASHFPPEAWPAHWEKIKEYGCLHFETVNIARNGREFPVEVTANYLNIDGVEYNCGLVREISDRKEAENEKQQLLEQLNHAQKLESIGRLAGGIAHDFNNLLTPILGYSELLLQRIPPDGPDGTKIETIHKAADKARILTQQLLSFGRKQILEMKTVAMNEVIRSFYQILRRTIRENIDIQLHLSEEILAIKADKNQLEQILMNLAINAQDAIKGNGIITIETAAITLDDEYVRQHAGTTAGNYLMLAVSDSGCGMDQQTLSHIFEPFYTTKGIGEGSGLGLATVYGLLRQHGGNVWVYSEVGKGTVFKLYFPLADDKPDENTEHKPEPLFLNAEGRTILLVEDNEMARNMVHDLFIGHGFKVLVEERPEQALKTSEGQHIDLLVTDVIMPDMNGPELHQRLLKTHPGLKVLYMSGYTNNAIVHHGVLNEGINFIQKPFAINDLARKVDDVLKHE